MDGCESAVKAVEPHARRGMLNGIDMMKDPAAPQRGIKLFYLRIIEDKQRRITGNSDDGRRPAARDQAIICLLVEGKRRAFNNEQISLLGPAKSSIVSICSLIPHRGAGEFDPSERPEAQSPIIQKNWAQNDQASGRPIQVKKEDSLSCARRQAGFIPYPRSPASRNLRSSGCRSG